MPPLPFIGPRLIQCSPAVLRAINALGGVITHAWWRPVRELRRELGLRPAQNPIFAGKHSPRLDLALFSPVLQPPQRDWPRTTVQAGFCFFDEPGESSAAPGRSSAGAAEGGRAPGLPPPVEDFLAAGEPPVVFTLGSSAVHAAGEFYAESARAAAKSGRRALLLVGSNPPPPNLPASILAWNYLPYAQIFPRASAVVHSGGVGTTAQTLRAGRPMLVMPFAFDQFDNAARIVRLGAGRALPRNRYRADSAAREIAALLGDTRHAEIAAKLGERIRGERGVETACEAIERSF